jgi:hypothetical protein
LIFELLLFEVCVCVCGVASNNDHMCPLSDTTVVDSLTSSSFRHRFPLNILLAGEFISNVLLLQLPSSR